MNPAEHYTRAEETLNLAAESWIEEDGRFEYLIRAAHIHALLATYSPTVVLDGRSLIQANRAAEAKYAKRSAL